MPQHILEVVTFATIAGTGEHQFLKAAETASSALQSLPGFIRRRVAKAEDGRLVGKNVRCVGRGRIGERLEVAGSRLSEISGTIGKAEVRPTRREAGGPSARRRWKSLRNALIYWSL
jgi:hypothetical protein